MSRIHHYRAEVAWSGAASGPTRSYDSYSRDWTARIDGKPPLGGSADPTFRGDPKVHNPEDLLLVALSTCHMLSYLALAARAKIAVLAYEDAADATMVLEGGGGRFSEVVLRPRVTVAAGTDLALAEQLHENAHEVCFIANSVNFPVRHEAQVEVAQSVER
jgi:organic hydroperoxide reductase OsmC/OhrA